MSLKEKLSEMSKRSKENAPNEVLNIMQTSADVLAATDIIKNSKKENDEFPSFLLKSHLDEEISSEDLLLDGPLVITFYRGNW